MNSEALQMGCTFLVVGSGSVAEVGVAIDLDGKLATGRVEIDHVPVDAVLAPELYGELSPFQAAPECALGRGGVVA